jgi:hypothetical protein
MLFAAPTAVTGTTTCASADPTKATGYTVVDEGTYKVLTVPSCSDKAYVLYPRDTSPPDLGDTDYKYFGVPLQSIGVTQTIPLTFLENLGERTAVKFISSYSTSSCAQKLVDTGAASIYDYDDAARAAEVEAVIVSGVQSWDWSDADSMDKLICDKSSSEPTLLAGAEWIKFWGLFFDKATAAATSHCETEARYTCNSIAASSISAASSHLTTSYAYQVRTAVFVSVNLWAEYFEGDGNSEENYHDAFDISTAAYKVALVQDAGATYPDLSAFGDYYVEASNVYRFLMSDATAVAQFHAAIANVDVLVDEGSPHHRDWATLNTQYDTASASTMPRAFTNGDVYTLDATMNSGGASGGTDWFESRIAEPDAILEDLIAVLHPGSSIAAAAPTNYLRDVHNGGGTATPVTELTAASCDTELSAVRPARSTSCSTRADTSSAFGFLTPLNCESLTLAAYPTCTLSPLPPSPPPPPPSASPALPGGSVVHVISFETTVTGTLATFDEEAFKTNLASGLTGVGAEDITISTASGSVIVTSEITLASPSVADSALTYLTTATTTSLTALLQVEVIAVAQPTMATVTVQPPKDDIAPLIGGIVGGVAAISLIVVGAIIYMRMNKKGADKPTMKATASSTSSTEASV